MEDLIERDDLGFSDRASKRFEATVSLVVYSSVSNHLLK